MKIKFSYRIFLLLFTLQVNLLFAEGKIDRQHWRDVKNGLQYDPRPQSDGNNKEWFKDFESSKSRRDGKGGFGKYSKDRKNRKGYEREGSDAEYGDKNDPGNKEKPEEREEINELPQPPKIPSINLSPLAWVVIAVGILLLIYILYKVISNMEMKKRKKVAPITREEEVFEPEPTELPKSELELRLEAALAKQDYREAIRIWFIFLIKALREKNWILWEKKKTNSSYLVEMRNRSEYSLFSQSVLYFELIWYGKREISREEYLKLEPLYKNLLQQVEKSA